MTDYLELAEMEHDDPEYIPEILPVDARISLRGGRSKFIELFERAAAVTPIPSKEIIAGTGYALLEAFVGAPGELSYARITASNGSMTISVLVDGLTVAMAGRVLLPGKRILDILKLAPTETIRFEVLGNAATIRSGRAQWTVATPLGDSLPTAAALDDITLKPVDREGFLNALEVTRRSVATTAARVALMQAQVFKGSIWSCNGALVQKQAVPFLSNDWDVTIPARVIEELIKALKSYDQDYFEMGYDEHHLVFQFGADTLIAQRLLIRFPEVQKLFLAPSMGNSNSLSVKTENLVDAIRRVRVNADPDYAALYLVTVPGKADAAGDLSWSLAVRARDSTGNASQELMDCQWVGSTKGRELCFNHKHLSDLLDSVDDEHVIIKVGEDTKTVRTPVFVEDIDQGFSAVLQQMRTGIAF